MAKMIYCGAYRTLIANLRALRLERGLKQADVGDRLGMSDDWVGKIEKGEVRLDLLHFVLLCRVYGVKTDELFRRFQEEVPA
jgi:transcriptional regulator with XRE-family HTH domain